MCYKLCQCSITSSKYDTSCLSDFILMICYIWVFFKGGNEGNYFFANSALFQWTFMCTVHRRVKDNV